MSDTNQLFLGAILTFFSLVFIEYIKSYFSGREKRKNIKIFIRLEFLTIIKRLDEFKKYIEEGSILNDRIIQEIEKNITRLDTARPDIIYLSKSSDQEDYYDLLSDLASYTSEIRIANQFYSNQKNLINNKGGGQDEKYNNYNALDNFFSQKRTEKLVELIDIKRRLEDYAKMLNEK